VRTLTLGLLLVGPGVSAANAQDEKPRHDCPGSPFTVVGGRMAFHVAVDGRLPPDTPPATVVMRLYDEDGGQPVAIRQLELPIGRTATLKHDGSGLFRAQATVRLPAILGVQPQPVASVELFDVDGFRAVIPILCGPPDVVGGGR
jgi:hypothetical protein